VPVGQFEAQEATPTNLSARRLSQNAGHYLQAERVAQDGLYLLERLIEKLNRIIQGCYPGDLAA
jgi:hypothetical protein